MGIHLLLKMTRKILENGLGYIHYSIGKWPESRLEHDELSKTTTTTTSISIL